MLNVFSEFCLPDKDSEFGSTNATVTVDSLGSLSVFGFCLLDEDLVTTSEAWGLVSFPPALLLAKDSKISAPRICLNVMIE